MTTMSSLIGFLSDNEVLQVPRNPLDLFVLLILSISVLPFVVALFIITLVVVLPISFVIYLYIRTIVHLFRVDDRL